MWIQRVGIFALIICRHILCLDLYLPEYTYLSINSAAEGGLFSHKPWDAGNGSLALQGPPFGAVSRLRVQQKSISINDFSGANWVNASISKTCFILFLFVGRTKTVCTALHESALICLYIYISIYIYILVPVHMIACAHNREYSEYNECTVD